MLFTVKRSAGPALVTAAALVVVAVLAREAGGLAWSLQPTPRAAIVCLLGVTGLLVADGVLHVAFGRLVGAAYRDRYAGLVAYYDGQSAVAIAAGGALAGAEELLFRGVLIGGAVQLGLLPVPAAVVVAALLFGAAHLTPTAPLRPFSLWAAWEGLLLGTLFVASGSLFVTVVAHASHDVAGFCVFAYQRRRARAGEAGR